LFLITLALNCSSDQQPNADTRAEITNAKTAIKEFAGALQAELKSAMKAGGPMTAIAVCNTQAMPITQQVATEKGMHLGRVSLKNRNPVNAPNEWQTAVLQGFEQQKATGKDVSNLAWSDTVIVEGGQEFRFMKAISTGSVCLQCHGTNLSPDVSQLLAGLYPEDRATGFREGDIRGAFVVTRKMTD